MAQGARSGVPAGRVRARRRKPRPRRGEVWSTVAEAGVAAVRRACRARRPAPRPARSLARTRRRHPAAAVRSRVPPSEGKSGPPGSDRSRGGEWLRPRWSHEADDDGAKRGGRGALRAPPLSPELRVLVALGASSPRWRFAVPVECLPATRAGPPRRPRCYPFPGPIPASAATGPRWRRPRFPTPSRSPGRGCWSGFAGGNVAQQSYCTQSAAG